MNVGFVRMVTEFGHLLPLSLPPGHKVIGERISSLNDGVTDYLVEGPDMPVWHEGAEIEAMCHTVTHTEKQRDGTLLVTCEWWPGGGKTWECLVPADDYRGAQTRAFTLEPLLQAAYKNRHSGLTGN